MANSATQHDPLKDHQEESSLELEQVEKELGAEEVESAEESAVNIDTESALEASGEEVALSDITDAELDKVAAFLGKGK